MVCYKQTSAQQREGECSQIPIKDQKATQCNVTIETTTISDALCTRFRDCYYKIRTVESFSSLQNANYSYSTFLKMCNSPPHKPLTESCAKSLREGTRLLKEGMENRQRRAREKSCNHSLGGCSGSCILRL